MSLRRDIQDLYYAISADIDHGECFYDKCMFKEFCANLDRMKELAQQYYNENKENDEDEDDDNFVESDEHGLTRLEETF